MPPKPKPIEERFWPKVFKHPDPEVALNFSELTPEQLDAMTPEEKGCWVWTGSTTNGYGMITVPKSMRSDDRKVPVQAYRIGYVIQVGPIPDGYTIDHRCRTRPCIRGSHLEPVTIRENKRRGMCPAAVHARKTHCIHGHEFNAENTHFRKDGRRECRTCGRLRQRVKK